MTADKDKRRAISREAARRRRRVESEVFRDLARLLPLQNTILPSLDKPSIIRLTLSYIRINALIKEIFRRKAECGHMADCSGEKPLVPSNETNMHLGITEGFLMVLSMQGDMIFLSDNVSRYMGLIQTELIGHNIFEYTHPCDHEEIRHNLRLSPEDVWCGQRRNFIIRIKSVMSHRGRSSNLKSATWKVLHCQGKAKVCVSSSMSCLLLTCQPLPLSHTLLSTHTFTSQHSMDMRFTYCDQRVTFLLGFEPVELIGRSSYDFCHTLDANCLHKTHVNLCLKSQSVSGQYRMLVKGGGYVWVETHSAVIPIARSSRFRPSTQQPLSILSVTYVLSGVKEPSFQLSLDQTVHSCFS